MMTAKELAKNLCEFFVDGKTDSHQRIPREQLADALLDEKDGDEAVGQLEKIVEKLSEEFL